MDTVAVLMAHRAACWSCLAWAGRTQGRLPASVHSSGYIEGKDEP